MADEPWTTESEDWLKSQPDGWDLPTDVDHLQQLVSLEHLMTLPVWQSAPTEVRAEVERRVAEERHRG